MARGSPKVGEQAQGLADAQQALFGTAGRLDVVPLGAAHGAQIHGIGLPAGFHRSGGQGLAGGVDGRTADEGGHEVEFMAELLGHGFQDGHALGHDLGTDAVTRQQTKPSGREPESTVPPGPRMAAPSNTGGQVSRARPPSRPAPSSTGTKVFGRRGGV